MVLPCKRMVSCLSTWKRCLTKTCTIIPRQKQERTNTAIVNAAQELLNSSLFPLKQRKIYACVICAYGPSSEGTPFVTELP